MRKTSLALLMGLSIAAVTTGAQAQSSDARDKAITACIVKAQAQAPGDSESVQVARTAAYKACMTAAGFAP